MERITKRIIDVIHKSCQRSFPLLAAAQHPFSDSPPPSHPPAFTEANKVLELKKTDNIAGVVHKNPISKEQLLKLFVAASSDRPWVKTPAQLQSAT